VLVLNRGYLVSPSRVDFAILDDHKACAAYLAAELDNCARYPGFTQGLVSDEKKFWQSMSI